MWAVVRYGTIEHVIRSPEPVCIEQEITRHQPDPETGEMVPVKVREFVQHPADIFRLWTPEELAAVGILPVKPADPPPRDRRITGTQFVLGDGVVIEVHTIAPIPPDELTGMKANLRMRVAAKRFAIETGGIKVGGTDIKTDRDSQAMIMGALLFTQRNPAATISWKGVAGFVDLTTAQIEAIADAVAAHVQACFAAERQHHQAIEAIATVMDAMTYDIEAGWPATA